MEKDSFDFRNGVQIRMSKLLDWEAEIVEELNNEELFGYRVRASGNSLVIGTRSKDGKITTIIVDSGYIENTYYKK